VEFLLFWKDHWMDAWDAAKVASLKENERRKYEARNQWGDIVEVREDGYWDTRGFDKEAFMVLKVPGMALDTDKMAVLRDADGKLLKKCKWFTNKTKIPPGILNKVESHGRVVEVTDTHFKNFVERKLG